eukprot:424479-Alexandrium_andersonii.AAC.1
MWADRRARPATERLEHELWRTDKRIARSARNTRRPPAQPCGPEAIGKPPGSQGWGRDRRIGGWGARRWPSDGNGPNPKPPSSASSVGRHAACAP